MHLRRPSWLPRQKSRQQDEQKKSFSASSPPVLPPISDLNNDNNVDTKTKGPEVTVERRKSTPSTPALSTSQRVWNSAYDALENDPATAALVRDYVTVLVKEYQPTGPVATEKYDIFAEIKSPTGRQMAMKQLARKGYAKVNSNKNTAPQVSGFVLSAKHVINQGIQKIPQAALPCVGACIGLQILLNAAQASKSILPGIAHVVSRLDWYCHLTDRLLSKEYIEVGNESLDVVLQQLEQRVVALYKSVLFYQMKSTCSHYAGIGFDYDGELKNLVDAEATVRRYSRQYNKSDARRYLRKLAAKADKRQSSLGDIQQDLWHYIAQQKTARMDDQDMECIRDLCVVDPQSEMEAQEQPHEASHWIFQTEEYRAFTNWSAEEKSRMLWLHGPAGTGKTTTLISIISSLSKKSKIAPHLAYVFCHTDKKPTTPTAALRSLMWMLLIQQPHLISYLRKEYSESGAALFTNSDAFFTLSNLFRDMLEDVNLSPVYLIIDALNASNQADLLPLILDTIKATKNTKTIKWLITSRPETSISTPLSPLNNAGTMLQLDIQGQEETNANVDSKISDEVLRRAKSTFSRASLMFGDNTIQSWIHGASAFSFSPPYTPN